MTRQRSIRCVFMRGGTSRGPFLMASDLPADPATRDAVLLRIMGSPDARQIDGLGGATTVTSKVAIVSPSQRPDADIDYLFAQVDIDQNKVDTAPTCGNMLAGVAAFAIEEGLVSATPGTTELVVHNVNTGSLIDAVVRTPDGYVTYEGDCAIAGVPGTAAPIDLRFRNISGSKTGALLPTGNLRDIIDAVEVTCFDAAMPMVLANAASFGLTACEANDEITANSVFMAKMQSIRHQAGKLMGLGDVTESVIPKFGIVAPPRNGGHFSSRYLTPWQCHPAYAVSGSICASACAAMPGTVVADVVKADNRFPNVVEIEHPSGSIEVSLKTTGSGDQFEVISGGALRTARRLMDGNVYVPASVWPAT
ncbi:MAG: 4-oxalomesaconate tautomerase [Burkholderiaceae bacterium]